MNASPQSPRTLELPFRWAEREGNVRVEIRENDDPAALGCPEFARGYPYCRATVKQGGRGYLDFLGWVQFADFDYPEGGFVIDPFMSLGTASQPFAFHGWEPILFDAPHSDYENWNFRVHSFLCGLGGELHDLRHEVRAVLGFSWGFSKRGEAIEFVGPDVLTAADWEHHHDYLARTFPEWTFPPGFFEHPLRP
jgi:hypothetical protein